MCRRSGWLPTGPPVPPWPGAGRHLRRFFERALRSASALRRCRLHLCLTVGCATSTAPAFGTHLQRYAVELPRCARRDASIPGQAYPAITVVRRTAQRGAVVATADASFDQATAHGSPHGAGPEWTSSRRPASLPPDFRTGSKAMPPGRPGRPPDLRCWNSSTTPSSRSRRARPYPVGIGVATGADAVYVRRDPPDIEVDRLLPLAMSQDTRSGELRWSGTYLVNPWGETGDLVELAAYPRLAAYLDRHAVAVRARNVAQRLPQRWSAPSTGRPGADLPAEAALSGPEDDQSPGL